MPKKKIEPNDALIELMQKLLIVELAKAGVPQNEIKKIIGVGIDKVNAIAKFLKGGKNND
jgi:hypothetical protein